jgi:hypothetical protein
VIEGIIPLPKILLASNPVGEAPPAEGDGVLWRGLTVLR